MKNFFKKTLLLLLTLSLLITMTACGGTDADGDAEDVNDSEKTQQNGSADDETGKENEDNKADTSLKLTIEQALEDHKRLQSHAGKCYYMDEEGNVYDTYSQYIVKMMIYEIPEGVSIEQVSPSGDYCFILGDDGIVYSNFSSGYFAETEKIVYIDNDVSARSPYEQYIYAVTEDGRVLVNDGENPSDDDLIELSGVTDAVQVVAFSGGDEAGFVAILHRDGTVSLDSYYEGLDEAAIAERFNFDLNELHSMTDIVFLGAGINGDDDEFTAVGLKSDGTVAVCGCYPEGVSSWTDMVYVNFAPGGVFYGLKSDGTPVVEWTDYVDESVVEQLNTCGKLKIFKMPFAGIGADGTVYGSAAYLYRAVSADRVEFTPELPGMDE